MNNKQFLASQKQLTMLKEALANEMAKDVPVIIKQASKPQLQELIDQVQAETLLHEAWVAACCLA